MTHLFGDSNPSYDVPGMWGGVYGGVNEGSPQAPIWQIFVNQLGAATGQSYGAPLPGV